MLTQEEKTRMFMSEVIDKLQIINELEKENEDLKNKLEKINNTLKANFIVIDKVQTFEKNQLEIINTILEGSK